MKDQLLGVGFSAILATLTLAGCEANSEQNIQQVSSARANPTVWDTDLQRLQRIPATGRAVELSHLASAQTKDIGLRRLALVNNRNFAAIIAIFIFDKNTSFTGLNVTLYRYTEDFHLDFPVPISSLGIGSYSNDEKGQMIARAGLSLPLEGMGPGSSVANAFFVRPENTQADYFFTVTSDKGTDTIREKLHFQS